MNSIFKLPFTKAKFYLILLACTFCIMATCNTDPKTVSPTARLEIFGTKSSGKVLDISYDGKTLPKPTGIPQVDPDDIVIRATGLQPDKNVKSVRVRLTGSNFKCLQPIPGQAWYNKVDPVKYPEGGWYYEFNGEGPSGVGIMVTKDHPLRDFASRFSCQSGTSFTEVQVAIDVEVENIAGRKTQLPTAYLTMKFKPLAFTEPTN